MQTPSTDDFMVSVRETLVVGLKFKGKMLARGLTTAWTKCPRCGGRIDAVLAGPKKHIHMSCRTLGCIQMME